MTCWVLRNRIVQSSPGEVPSYLAPSATQRSMSRDLFLGQRVLLVRHPRLAVGPDQLDQVALVGLARLERDPFALLAPLGELGEGRHDVLALRLPRVVAGDAVLDQDRRDVSHEADGLARAGLGRPGRGTCFFASVDGGASLRQATSFFVFALSSSPLTGLSTLTPQQAKNRDVGETTWTSGAALNCHGWSLAAVE